MADLYLVDDPYRTIVEEYVDPFDPEFGTPAEDYVRWDLHLGAALMVDTTDDGDLIVRLVTGPDLPKSGQIVKLVAPRQLRRLASLLLQYADAHEDAEAVCITAVRESMTAVVESGHQARILGEVAAEAARAGQTWGPQTHLPDGTGPDVRVYIEGSASEVRDDVRKGVNALASVGKSAWTPILLEEAFEAFAEDDPARLRAELIQVAAVALRWVTAIDIREAVTRD